MKVLVNRAALVEALGLASSVVLTRTPKPVLTCVKLVAGPALGGGSAKTLTVIATDMEIALQYTLTQVDIASPGVALIPAGKLSEIVNNSPDDTLTLDTTADSTVIKGSDAHYKVFGYNADEYPPVSSFEGTPDFSLTAGALRTLLDRTRFAAAREMTRYAINGVLFEKKGKKLSLVATDGHRLAQTKDDTIAEGRQGRLRRRPHQSDQPHRTAVDRSGANRLAAIQGKQALRANLLGNRRRHRDHVHRSRRRHLPPLRRRHSQRLRQKSDAATRPLLLRRPPGRSADE